jgi:hypothetical protein
MPQSPDDLPAREILEVGRRMGDHIDQNAVKRASEAVRDHERRHHANARTTATDSDKIPDETIRAIIRQSEKEGCGLPYAVECHDVQWSQFVIDLADYEGRLREEVDQLRWGRRS